MENKSVDMISSAFKLALEEARLPGRRSARGHITRGRAFGRRLEHFKFINGKKYQLHATKGWKPA